MSENIQYRDLQEGPMPFWLKAYAFGWLPLAAAYALILAVSIRLTGLDLFATYLSNVIIPFVMGIPVFLVTYRWTAMVAVRIQSVIHICGAILFALIWTQALFRLLQLWRGLQSGDWTFSGFSGPALAWQLFQGVAIYFLIVGGAYVYWFARRAAEKPGVGGKGREQPTELERFFIRSGDMILPVDVAEIVWARAEADGVTLNMKEDSRFIRLPLVELEHHLGDRFIRTHRSTLVNVAQIQSVEPAGNGRLSLHVSNGDSLVTSRDGASRIRRLVL